MTVITADMVTLFFLGFASGIGVTFLAMMAYDEAKRQAKKEAKDEMKESEDWERKY